MGYLSKAAILGASDLQTQDVHVPEWGGDVRVRGLTGTERDAFEATIAQRKGKDVKMNFQNARARLVSLSAVDESGERLFSDADVVALGGKSAAALDRLFAVAMKLSGLTPDDVKDLTENLDSGQSDDSTSA
jgi:hypothetical protein